MENSIAQKHFNPIVLQKANSLLKLGIRIDLLFKDI